MPEVVHGDVRIRFSVQGEGPPLVLHHGAGSNRTTWLRHGYAKALRERYQLILIDARGHGQSEKPLSAAAHALPLRVGDVTAVLDALEIRRAHFLGYSMGRVDWLWHVMATLRQRVSLEEVVSQISVPCWLFAEDRRYQLIEQARRAIRGAELLSLPGLGHLQTFASADRVLPGLSAFLEASSA